ncbi:MAG: glycogen-binding domain-containing protein [bacterium]|nr:glycogen-binding domain-containing protein [bacterium]
MAAKPKKRTTFRLLAPGAKKVCVLGSFNGWVERPMKANKAGEWSTWTNLESGRYEYRFKVDGHWHTTANVEKVPNKHGSENNLLIV